MSAVDLTSLYEVSQLMEQFNDYENVFELSFLHYNGKNEVITLQYRLRTYKSFMDGEEFLKNFLEQYLKHPIQIPSNLYSVQINDQNSTRNLALDKKYFIKVCKGKEEWITKEFNYLKKYWNKLEIDNFQLIEPIYCSKKKQFIVS